MTIPTLIILPFLQKYSYFKRLERLFICRPGLALLILYSYCAHTDLPMTSYPACTTTSTSHVSSLTQFHTPLPLLSTPPLCIYRGLRAIQNRQSSHTWLSGSTVISPGRLLYHLWFNTLIFPFDILIHLNPTPQICPLNKKHQLPPIPSSWRAQTTGMNGLRSSS